MSKTFPICRKCQTRLRLGANIVWYILSALFAHALPEEDGIMLHTRSTGGLFNLSWLRAPRPSGFWFVNCCTPMTLPVFHSEMHLQNLCERFAKACYDFSMTINLKKTVVMSLVTSSPPRILVNGSLLNVVDKFPYLGSVVNSSNNLTDKINQRIRKASTNFGRHSSRVGKVTTSKSNWRSTPGLHRMHPECSVIGYSSETWCTYRCQENQLNTFHFRCRRSILGVSWRDHVPNSTILHLTGSYDLTTIIRKRRLLWLGHHHRMEDIKFFHTKWGIFTCEIPWAGALKWGARGKVLRLPFLTPLYITLTMILWEYETDWTRSASSDMRTFLSGMRMETLLYKDIFTSLSAMKLLMYLVEVANGFTTSTNIHSTRFFIIEPPQPGRLKTQIRVKKNSVGILGQMRQNAYHHNLNWTFEGLLPFTVKQQRPRAQQSARKIRNLPLLAKDRKWANCTLALRSVATFDI